MTPEELDAIRGRWAAATPGPWLLGEVTKSRHGFAEVEVYHRSEPDPWAYDEDEALPEPEEEYLAVVPALIGTADAEAIAAAPTDIGALLAEVDRLRAEAEWWEARVLAPDCTSHGIGNGRRLEQDET